MIPCVHRAHRGHQFLARRLLEQITESACLKSLENMFRGVIHREDQDTGVGTSLLYGACGIDAIEFGHGDVHHDNRGLKTTRLTDPVAPVCGIADHADIGFRVQQAAQAVSYDGVIIGQKNRDDHGYRGTSTIMRVPWPTTDSMRSRPPTAARRSRTTRVSQPCSCPKRGIMQALNPIPSSMVVRRTSRGSVSSLMVAVWARACFPTLDKHSCATRIKVISTVSGRRGSGSPPTSVVVTPVRLRNWSPLQRSAEISPSLFSTAGYNSIMTSRMFPKTSSASSMQSSRSDPTRAAASGVSLRFMRLRLRLSAVNVCPT